MDSRPPDYGIPAHEQDHDSFRHEDGQEVVDLLNQPDVDVGDDADAMVEHEDIGTLLPETDAAFLFGQNMSVSEMLYGHDGTLERPVAWRAGGAAGHK